MTITRADVVLAGVCPRHLARPPPPAAPWTRVAAPADLPWTDDQGADALLSAQPSYTLFAHVNASAPARVVVGSRHQAWVRGNEATVRATLAALTNWRPTPPRAARFFVSLTDAPGPRPARIAAALLLALRPHVRGVHLAWSRRSQPSAAPALDNRTHLLAVHGGHAPLQLRAALGFAPLPPGTRLASVAPAWQVEQWVQHYESGLCAAARATARVLPAGVRVAHPAVQLAPLEAFEAAEAAFFHPDALALLYFPGDHKAAVYLPVFFPAAYAVLSTWVAWLRERHSPP